MGGGYGFDIRTSVSGDDTCTSVCGDDTCTSVSGDDTCTSVSGGDGFKTPVPVYHTPLNSGSNLRSVKIPLEA